MLVLVLGGTPVLVLVLGGTPVLVLVLGGTPVLVLGGTLALVLGGTPALVLVHKLHILRTSCVCLRLLPGHHRHKPPRQGKDKSEIKRITTIKYKSKWLLLLKFHQVVGLLKAVSSLKLVS